MKQRPMMQVHRILVHTEFGRHAGGIGTKVGMAQHHTLGGAGRAAGV